MDKAKITTLMLPDCVHKALKRQSKVQGTSMSWIVVESLLLNEHFDMTQDELDGLRGYGIPKTFKERRKKKKKT